MKKIFLVFLENENGKHHAHFETIQAGENLRIYVDRYSSADVIRVCENATQAAYLAEKWNREYKENDTYSH